MNDLFKEKAKDWDNNDRARILSTGIGACILKHVPLQSGMHVMDFGAGTGLIASQVAPHVEKITAVDVSESMLAKLSAKEELKGKVIPVCQDITLEPLALEFDLIMSAMAMHHVEDTNNMVAKFAHHLKPGGAVALADLDLEDGTFHALGTEGVYHPGFERDAFAAILSRHGFDDIQFHTACTLESEEKTYPVFLVKATKR